MKSCKKPGPAISFKFPCHCQWLCRMKKFRQKHEEKCKAVELPGPSTHSHEFLTGSYYEGDWQPGCGMHGEGVYRFTNGVEYEGEFFEGAFHGKGELRYQTPAGKAVIRGHWNKGLMSDKSLLFDGALEHDEQDWQYCKMPDRRFTREYAEGLKPAGESIMTAYQPYVEVPEGYADTGDGFFDIKRKLIYEHSDFSETLSGPTVKESVRRAPALPEQRWILENCRVGKKDMTIGPRQDLYEKWMDPALVLEQPPPPPANYLDISKKVSVFNTSENLDAPLFYDTSKSAGPPVRKFQPTTAPTRHGTVV